MTCLFLVSAAFATTVPTGDTGVVPGTGDTGAPLTGDTGTAPTTFADFDVDRDGYTIGNGDCDDADSQVHPGAPEVCADRRDNNCDGFFDEACDSAVQLASLRGGGGCTGGAGLPGTQAVLFVPLLLLLLPLTVLRRRP